MKQFFASMWSAAKGSISCKRVCGWFGFTVSCIDAIYCSIVGCEPPEFLSQVLWASVALLGADTGKDIVTGIVKKTSE